MIFEDIKFEEVKKMARNMSLPLFQKYGKIYFQKKDDELIRNGKKLTWFNALEFDYLFNNLQKNEQTILSNPVTMQNKNYLSRGRK